MDHMEAMRARHSVRAYTDRPVEAEKRRQLEALADRCNGQGGLHIRCCWDDPEGFDSRLAHYGSFRGVHSYLVLAGPPAPDLEEKCGYYGEKLVLAAQCMGLNTCWAALTFHKAAVKKRLLPGDRLVAVIAVGYGANQGVPHKSRPWEKLVDAAGEDLPEWFRRGAQGALLAPTALNQQKFRISLEAGEPVIRAAGFGPYTKVDLGIVKYHFEAASGHPVR